jgi:hypothetical protein
MLSRELLFVPAGQIEANSRHTWRNKQYKYAKLQYDYNIQRNEVRAR